MADKKENSRADELFEILSEYSDKKPQTVKETLDSSDDASNVDDILEILSKGSSRIENNYENTEPTEEEAEIPEALFSHLSEESDTVSAQAEDASPVGEELAHFSNHFSEDDGSIPLPPIEEEEEAVPEETEKEKLGVFAVLGSIVRNVALVPKAVVYIALVLVVAVYLSYYIITIGNDVFALVTDTREVSITIDENATHESVGKLLEEKGCTDGHTVHIYDFEFDFVK